MSSPTVTSNTAHGALKVTLQRNFSQIMQMHVGKRLDVEARLTPSPLDAPHAIRQATVHFADADQPHAFVMDVPRLWNR